MRVSCLSARSGAFTYSRNYVNVSAPVNTLFYVGLILKIIACTGRIQIEADFLLYVIFCGSDGKIFSYILGRFGTPPPDFFWAVTDKFRF
jgi:hypothetical protein